jgi:NarL family two-component system response regulator LiaR
MTEQINILVVDDHAVVRTGISAWIASEPDLFLSGEAADGEEAVAKALELQPDVILMDLILPKKDGIDAIKDIIQGNPEARILVITSFSEKDNAIQAIKAGAMGFMMKDTSPESMLQAIREVHKGNPWLSAEITRMLIHEDIRAKETISPVEKLTDREMDVLRLIAQGLPDKDIANQLTVSKATVRYHVTNILTKLHLENRTQAALYAIREGHVSI